MQPKLAEKVTRTEVVNPCPACWQSYVRKANRGLPALDRTLQERYLRRGGQLH